MLRTLKGTLDLEGKIQFAESVHLTRPYRVLVTLLDDEQVVAEEGLDQDDLTRRLIAFLESPEFRKRPYGSPEEIEARILENRSAWEN
jgi:hypothetical protein